jgi:hypothetical protein
MEEKEVASSKQEDKFEVEGCSGTFCVAYARLDGKRCNFGAGTLISAVVLAPHRMTYRLGLQIRF